jgi:hypothetical protein
MLREERDRLRVEVIALRAGANAGDDVARLGADLDAARREAAEALALAESLAMDLESQRRLLEESRAAAAQREAERDVALVRVRELEVASEDAGHSDDRLPSTRFGVWSIATA